MRQFLAMSGRRTLRTGRGSSPRRWGNFATSPCAAEGSVPSCVPPRG